MKEMNFFDLPEEERKARLAKLGMTEDEYRIMIEENRKAAAEYQPAENEDQVSDKFKEPIKATLADE
ncbi:hypothetical protein [Methylocaldum sp.]|jgi:hypothetical protein|uniref:hypothetical protein n=1 Tax=Methylocaldum sp. TaxID=1969727 RepID=UPI0032203D89